jgi:hypothetical protein
MRVKGLILTCVGVASVLMLFANPGSAAAADFNISLGPIPLPDVPVEICVNSTCVESPELSSIELTATASTSGIALPVVVPASCPSGQVGVVLNVTNVLPSNVTISGELSGELSAGGEFSTPIGPITVPGLGGSATISACAEL